MARLWLRVIANQKILMQDTEPCNWGQEKEVLVEMCKRLDLPCPIWLKKHENEYDRFRSTAFRPEHFIETVSFDRLEIVFLDDTGKKRKSEDPRNQF